ncbi:hypothetical protein, partial [Streptomyces tendae]|uniref:hypothetical protein n=1 Tax=Streptomyces tendae TaxID=1932 RepID=UPI00371BAB84
MGEIPAADVVTGACDALVAGPALDELGLTFHPAGSVAGQEAAVRALAARVLAGELTPRELVFRIHQRLGHELPLAEGLANLDDEYDVLEYGGRTSAQVDADVVAPWPARRGGPTSARRSSPAPVPTCTARSSSTR